MLLRKIFENLHAVMTILALFLTIFGKKLFNCFVPNSECFTKYGTFCSHILDLCVLKA